MDAQSAAAPPARVSALVRRALTGALAVTVAAGCNPIGEPEAPAVDVAGRYVLTHHNGNPVPVVTDQVPAMTEELQAGDVVLAVDADSTFGLALVWRDTYTASGTSETTLELFRGSFTKSGSTVRLTVREEDGEAEQFPWFVTGDLRAGVLRLDLGEEKGAVLTFRKE